MTFLEEGKSRRRFLHSAAWLGAGLRLSVLTAREQIKADAFAALPKGVWANARRNGLVMLHRPEPVGLSHRAQIVRADEPGPPLIVAGQVLAPDGETPLAGITVYAYHTDAQGYYGSDHQEYPPRLYGWMKTDASGHFELHTIDPGHYPGLHVPAHVHFVLWGQGYPPQWAEELRFAGDPYLTQEMRAEAAEQGAFSSIQPLTHTAEGVLHCCYSIRLQTKTNFC